MRPFSLHSQANGSHRRKEERRGHQAQVWIGAKIQHPLRFLKPLIDDDWE